MITGFFGDLGSGKTLSMTKYAYCFYLKGYTIYSNYGLSFPHHKVDSDFLQKVVKEDIMFEGNICFALDEFDMYIDSRMSVSKKNIVISYFIKQIRKKNIELMYATQMEHSIDRRLRFLTRTHVLCDKHEIVLYSKNSNEPIIVNILTNHVFINRKSAKTRRFIGNTYYPLYDTNELIVYDERKKEK